MNLAKIPILQKLAGGGLLERLWLGFISRVQLILLYGHKDNEVVWRMYRIRRERRTVQTAYETFMVHTIARSCRCLPGEMSEVGVFQGASAKLISEVKGDKELHLFDTFEGLPDPSEADRGVHKPKMYACSLESVQGYLKDYENLHFHPGLFPDSTADVPERKYCFVHMDVDLYESTAACLEYFYPRMVPGGIMLSHDYSILAGVKKAFTEFFADKPEEPIEQPSTQCMVIKLPECLTGHDKCILATETEARSQAGTAATVTPR